MADVDTVEVREALTEDTTTEEYVPPTMETTDNLPPQCSF